MAPRPPTPDEPGNLGIPTPAPRPPTPDEPGNLGIPMPAPRPPAPRPPQLTTAPSQSSSSLATKRKRAAATKRVKDPRADAIKKKQPRAKKFKPPMAGKSPVLTSSVVVTTSPMATGTPVVTSTIEVRRSPVVTSPPTMRMAVSPMVIRPQSSPLSPSPTGPPSTQHPGSMPTKTKTRKLTSTVWNDMDPVYSDGKLINATCKHCNEVFTAARNSGTTHMRRHLRGCQPRLKMVEMVEKLKSSTDTSVLTNWQFDRTVTRCELVRLIVLHELPFSFVEYEGFRTYSLSLNPLAESVSRTTIKENCMQAYRNHRLTLRELFADLDCRFSLTADLWTSNQNTGYMVITCHYLDRDWKVQKRIIKFCIVKTPHDGFNLYIVMLNTIRYYNLEDKICSITLDNAAANNSMIDMLRTHLLSKSLLHGDGTLFHTRCAAHVLNLIVKDGLQEIDSVIHDVRESVKYIKGSTSRKEKFEEIVVEIGINCRSRPTLDVPTRWNSTCDMLESASPFKEAFLELAKQDPNYLHLPSIEDWKRADEVCKLLIVFKKATEVVSGTRYPTSNLYFHQIWNVREVLKSNELSTNPVIAYMVSEMKAKFDKYWQISYMANCIPVILDPRFKFELIEFRLSQAFEEEAGYHIGKVEKALRSLYNGYASEMGESFNSSQRNENAASVKSHSWSDWSNMRARSNQVTVELDRYLRDELFPCDDENFDILHWWKMHAAQYPIVSRMARDVLAAPASTVASESAFSTGGRIINDHRTRLSGNTVEALICFQDWLREAGSSYLDIINVGSLDSIIEDLGGV